MIGGALPAAAQQDAPPVPWVAHRVLVPAAAQVDLSHLGAHTHANVIRFDTGNLDVGGLRSGRPSARLRSVRVVGHCRLPTDRAALPPGLSALLQDYGKNYGPVPTYGPIDGNPGWSFVISHVHGRIRVRYTVPTRFANWVAAQPPALRRRYLDPHSYSLEITWEQQGAG